MKELIVYTIQSEEAWQQFKKQGYLSGSEKSACKELKDSYLWLMEQMKKRIPSYNGDYPIWFWGKKDRPNRNEKAWGPHNSKQVLLTLDIPDEWILWSDHGSWHAVLNDLEMWTEEEEEMIKKGELSFSKEESWERIFDLDYLLNDPDWYKGTEDTLVLQGTASNIPLSCVVKVRRFRSKCAPRRKWNKPHTKGYDRKEARLNKIKRKTRKQTKKRHDFYKKSPNI